MKTLFYLLIFTFLRNASYCQNNGKADCYKESFKGGQEKVFTKMEIPPTYKEGNDKWNQNLLTNIDINIIGNSFSENTRFYSDTILVAFIISKDGKMSNLTVQNSHSNIIENEIRKAIIRSSCSWVPGSSGGRLLNGWYKGQILIEFDRRGSFLSIKVATI